MSGGKPRPLSFEAFDPWPSIRTGLQLVGAAQVPFALVGRLAVWAWVSADEQEFTKDVDFAVPSGNMVRLEEVAREHGYETTSLPIGGFAIRDGQTRVDFIDRRVDFADLYADAVLVANRDQITTTTDDGKRIPVASPEHLVAMKLATGDPRDERDVERILGARGQDYAACRQLVRKHLGPAAANRLDHIGARIGIEPAARYVRQSNGSPGQK